MEMGLSGQHLPLLFPFAYKVADGRLALQQHIPRYSWQKMMLFFQIDEYRVDGILAALYVINLGIGPDPISPFVIYAACHNDAKCMDFDLSYLSALILDDELYEIVEIVYQFNTLEALNTSALHQNPLLKWAIHLLGIEVSKLY